MLSEMVTEAFYIKTNEPKTVWYLGFVVATRPRPPVARPLPPHLQSAGKGVGGGVMSVGWLRRVDKQG